MGAARMKPRASMPTTLVIGASNGAASSSVAARNAPASPSSGVMSRNTTPGCGKSGMSRMKGQSWSASTGRRLGPGPQATTGGAPCAAAVGSAGCVPGGTDVHDLVIRNGTGVDGRGGTPVLADVAVDDGRITPAGTVDQPGREGLDAH